MIRKLTIDDFDDLKEAFFNSFSTQEAPITLQLISDMIANPVQQSSLCLGYLEGEKIVGAVAFSPVFFDESTNLSGYILAPLAVHDAHQKKGIATKLINEGKSKLTANGVDALFVYGDPNYYGKHGFDVALGAYFIPPYPLEYEFGWQAMMLSSKDIGGTAHHFRCIDALSDASLW